ncbi:MAG: V-type ATP synthase subunit D [Spirochaetota bacterium]
MAKVKLTKNELKRQKDALKRFTRYLPTLQLKKQQLQMVIRRVETELAEKNKEYEAAFNTLQNWIEVFGEDAGLEELIEIESLVTDIGNIAGVDIPVFKHLVFKDIKYDLFDKPLWTDKGVEKIKKLAALEKEIAIFKEQIWLLSEELRITTQRVNLFEKIKIPETKENIRKINIYLGDQQTAAVVRGKIAKKNLVKVS